MFKFGNVDRVIKAKKGSNVSCVVMSNSDFSNSSAAADGHKLDVLLSRWSAAFFSPHKQCMVE